MAGLVPDSWGLGYLTDYTRPRSNTLLGLSAGLLSGNLANAPLYAMEGKKADDAYATAEKEKAAAAAQLNQTIEFLRQTAPKYAEAVQAGVLSPGDAYTMYVNDQKPKAPRPPIEINGQLVDPDTYEVLGDFRTPDQMGGGGSTEYGLVPIWGQFADGSFGYGVQGKDGSFKKVDTGDLTPLDPRTLSTERAVGSAVGTGQGKAIVSAPAQLTNGGMALGLIDEIKNHPELPWATGRSAAFGLNDARINPQRAAFQDLVDQAKGGAFLTAIQQLQGLGALSNAEGAAATTAINRINTAVEKADFLKALEDYEMLVKKGMAKAEAILQSQGLNQQGLPAVPSNSGFSILSVTP